MMDLKIKIPRRRQFYALFSILMLLLLFRYALLVHFPSIVFVAVLAMIAFMGDRDEILAVCVCCIPLCAAMQYYYVVSFCIIVYLLKYGRDIKLDFSFVPMFLIIIWEILHCFSENTNFKALIAMTLPYILFIVLISIRDIKPDYSFIVRVFSVMVLCTVLVMIVRLLIVSNYDLNSVFMNMYRLGSNSSEESTEFIINPNSLGIQCVLAISCLMQLRMNGQKKAGDLVMIISLLVLGALTASRTYLACLLIMVAFLFWASKGGVKKKLKLLIGSLLFVLIAIVILYLLFPAALEAFVKRLQVDDLSGGRLRLFVQYNEYLMSSVKSLLWGIGSLDLPWKVKAYSISEGVPHNGIQEILVAWGILGLLLFLALIYVLIRRSKQENPHQTKMNYLLLVILFAKALVGQVITSPYTMLAFALVYLSLCYDFSSTEQVNQSRL